MLKFSDIDNVILYGAGSISYKIYDKIKKCKEIDCIIDKNSYKQIDKFDCPIVSIDNISNYSKKKSLVIITLQNANQHCDIANEIYKKGNKYIIFLPMDIKAFNDLKYQMFELYQQIMEGENLQDLLIPSYTEMLNLLFEDSKDNLYSSKSKCVTVKVPVEYVFSSDINNKNEQCAKYHNKNIMAFKPWFELFEFINGNGKYPKNYLKCQRDTITAQRELLIDRFKLWNVYEKIFYSDVKVFDYMPAYAEWNNLGYFNVIDGHHRLIYLLRKGYRELPLRVSVEDYQNYNTNCKLKILNNDDINIMRDITFYLLNWCLERNIIFKSITIYAESEVAKYFIFNLIKNNIAINVKSVGGANE